VQALQDHEPVIKVVHAVVDETEKFPEVGFQMVILVLFNGPVDRCDLVTVRHSVQINSMSDFQLLLYVVFKLVLGLHCIHSML